MKTDLLRLRASAFLFVLPIICALAGSVRAQTINGGFDLVEPTNRSTFVAPTTVHLVAHGDTPFIWADRVTFFSNAVAITVVSNGTPDPFGGFDSVFDWTNAPAGTYAISAELVRPNAIPLWTRTNTISVVLGHYLAVDIVQPTNDTVYPRPTNVDLLAGGLDTNGEVAYVEFFDGSKSLGFVSNGVVLDPIGGPNPFPPRWQTGDLAYLLTWSNQYIGTHILTAEIVDTNGETAYSPPLTVIIGSNIPPKVDIATPPNGAVFFAPVNIPIVAFASSPLQVASVQFFAGTNSLGFGTNFHLIAEPGIPIIGPVPGPNFFTLTWTNPTVGSFDLTAVATDSIGSSSTSAPVTISIVGRVTPPATNFPDVVSVVATDPIAIASTNCWVWRGLTNGTNGSNSWSQWASPSAIWTWFTNCGPKDATFTVFRRGVNTNDLIVNYTLGGTATNGADYETLPDSVTIPAGDSTAVITIVPIENGSNYVRTVTLMLDPSTNQPPSYFIGFNSKAEAIITSQPFSALPGAALLTGGGFHFGLSGPSGAWFRIDFSTNLTDWTPLCTNQVVDGEINFVDPNAGSSGSRLYRSVPLPSGPGN